MRRSLCLLATLLLLAAAAAAPLPREQRDLTLAFLRGLRNPDGGYRPAPAAGPSQLGATSAALRAVRYLGGKPEGPEQTLRFVRSCQDPGGGFADTPGGRPDVRSTAMGLMALAELGAAPRDPDDPIARYLNREARTLPEIYIAVAAFDAAGLKTPRAEEWIAAFEATRRPDGTYGTGPVDTAGAVITIRRLGGRLRERDPIASLLRSAQRPDGGFAADGASDLSTSYRIMRALWMLRERPDLERLRDFVARCRNADGGYGPAPGQPSATGPTYFAAILLHWADDLAR